MKARLLRFGNHIDEKNSIEDATFAKTDQKDNQSKVLVENIQDAEYNAALGSSDIGEASFDTKSTSLRDSESMGEHIGYRLIRVLILAACYFVLEIVVKAVTIVQFIFVAWKKQPHPGMQRLGTMIAEYMHGMWNYCTFASDNPPWPFTPWPRGESRQHQ